MLDFIICLGLALILISLAKPLRLENRATQKAADILNLLNEHLSTHTWLEFEHPTIADVAVFPYVALARDGKINVDAYPNILSWIDRIKQLPGYVPMTGI
jgi:glutathione S-transferase